MVNLSKDDKASTDTKIVSIQVSQEELLVEAENHKVMIVADVAELTYSMLTSS